VYIASNLEKRQGAAANAGSYQEGSVGIGLAVSVFQSDVQATVGGTISAGGRVTVAAEITTPNNRTFADAVVGDTWLSKKVRSWKSGVGPKTGWDKFDSLAEGVMDKSAKVAQGIFSKQGLLGMILQPGGKPLFDKYSGQTKPLAVAGAIAVADHEDNVTARIEPGATVITTGGTGISPRDTTYEALSGLLLKRLDGFGELFRLDGLEPL
jgi:hypothetical protein